MSDDNFRFDSKIKNFIGPLMQINDRDIHISQASRLSLTEEDDPHLQDHPQLQ